MKINKNHGAPVIPFSEVLPGQCFTVDYRKGAFIRIKRLHNDSGNAVSLDSGDVCCFIHETKVTEYPNAEVLLNAPSNS